jgi:pyruvate dehydrogenase E2 component (dihydrolipoamide acetyltransferase)
MATKVHMEALSPTMEEGQLVKWLKQEGDAVSEGDVLAEIETDKATMELVARGSGVLRDVRVKEGDTAPVGEVIAMIGGEGEAAEGAGDDAGGDDAGGDDAGGDDAAGDDAAGDDAAGDDAGGDDAAGDDAAGDDAAGDGAPARPAREAVGSEASGRPARQESKTPADEGTGARKSAAGAEPSEVRDSEADAGEEGQDAEPGRGARKAGDGGRVKASPLARRMAEESGIDIESVEGTGPAGRITKRDIEAAVQDGAAEAKGDDAPKPREQRAAAAGDAPQAGRDAAPAEREVASAGREAGAAEREAGAARAPRPSGADSEEVPVTQMRKTIAKRLVQSIGPVPTFYLTIEVDMTRLMELRARANRHLERDGVKASINDFIIKALAEALKRHPEVNASWSDSAITRHHRVHVGVAVAVEDGLMTPVIRDADTRRIRDIAVDVKELAARAREKKLKPDEYTGATFSISNLGMFGITEFTAIINPPEAGIIAVGAVEEKPVVEDGAVVVRPRMRMTMSCDHRVVDGATGARFLQTLRELVEDPVMILA